MKRYELYKSLFHVLNLDRSNDQVKIIDGR